MQEFLFGSNNNIILYNNAWIKVKYFIILSIVTIDRYKYKVFK